MQPLVTPVVGSKSASWRAERTPTGVISAGIRAWTANYGDITAIYALVLAPLAVATLIVYVLMVDEFRMVANSPIAMFSTQTELNLFSMISVAVAVLVTFLSLVAQGAVYALLDGRATDSSYDWRDALKRASAVKWPLLWGTFLATLGVGALSVTGVLTARMLGLEDIAVFAAIIPGIWLMARWSVVGAVIVLEGATGFESLKRSSHLVSSRWWATFGAISGSALYITVLVFVMALIGGMVVEALFGDAPAAQLIISQIAAHAWTILITPVAASITFMIYADLKARNAAPTKSPTPRGNTPLSTPPPAPKATFMPCPDCDKAINTSVSTCPYCQTALHTEQKPQP